MATPSRSKILNNSSFCLLNTAATAVCTALFQQEVSQDLAKLLKAEFPHASYLRVCIPFPSTPQNMEIFNLLAPGKCQSRVVTSEGSAVQQVVASKTAKLFTGTNLNTASDVKQLCEEMNLRAVICAPLPETSDLHRVFNNVTPKDGGPPSADSLSSKVHGCVLLGLPDEAHARKCMPRLIVLASLVGPYLCTRAFEFPATTEPTPYAPLSSAPPPSLPQAPIPNPNPSWLDGLNAWELLALQQVASSRPPPTPTPRHSLDSNMLPVPSMPFTTTSLTQAYMNSFLQAGPTLGSTHRPLESLVAATQLLQQQDSRAQAAQANSILFPSLGFGNPLVPMSLDTAFSNGAPLQPMQQRSRASLDSNVSESFAERLWGNGRGGTMDLQCPIDVPRTSLDMPQPSLGFSSQQAQFSSQQAQLPNPLDDYLGALRRQQQQ